MKREFPLPEAWMIAPRHNVKLNKSRIRKVWVSGNENFGARVKYRTIPLGFNSEHRRVQTPDVHVIIEFISSRTVKKER